MTHTGTPYKDARDPREWTDKLDNPQQRASKAQRIKEEADRKALHAKYKAMHAERKLKEQLLTAKHLCEKKVSDIVHYQYADIPIDKRLRAAKKLMLKKKETAKGAMLEAIDYTLTVIDMHLTMNMYEWPLHNQPGKIPNPMKYK